GQGRPGPEPEPVRPVHPRPARDREGRARAARGDAGLMSRSPAEVIHGPLVTERTYALFQVNPRGSVVPRYTFRVAIDATKPEIARALEEVYEAQGIKVVAVNTIRVRGKVRRTGRRGVVGRTSDWKKAIVTLQEGQRLEGLFGS